MIAGYDVIVTINGTGISGASIASYSENENLELISSLGNTYINQLPNGFSVVNFSITKPLCISGGEPLLQLTGNIGVSGTIQTSQQAISFQSAYLNKYSVNYSMDEGPNATLDFLVFGAMGTDSVANPQWFSGGNHFAKRSLINLDLEDMEALIDDFSYSFEINRFPIYSFGSLYPAQVATVGPRKFSLSAKGYIDDLKYETNVYNLIGVNKNHYLDLSTYGGLSGNVLLDRQSGFFHFDSQNISVSIDDEMSFGVEATTYF